MLLRPSGLKGRFPEPTAVEYSLMSRYSGFLYHVNHEGQCIVAVVCKVGKRMGGERVCRFKLGSGLEDTSEVNELCGYSVSGCVSARECVWNILLQMPALTSDRPGWIYIN